MLKYIDTPIFEIKTDETEKAGVKIFVKREGLNHPYVSGNKWWKLKYNLIEAKENGFETLLTFGGAFSNHIYATAAAAKELNFKSIGIIRGEENLPLNKTLSFAKTCGMNLHYISREDYRRKSETTFIEKLKDRFGNFYLIPEGGTNVLAVNGCAEFAKEKIMPVDCTHICLPVGTGGTIAGIISGLNGQKKICGFSVLKDGYFLEEEIKKLTDSFFKNWEIKTEYHFGGYAKTNSQLNEFILKMKKDHDLPLDPVYTGKMFFGVFDLVQKNYFERGSVILVLHTGGLQGAE